MNPSAHDLIIIGGSAAGSAAAVYAARRNLDFVMLAKDFGGEVAVAGEIENYLGFPHTTGLELSDAFRKHLASYNVEPDTGIMIGRIEKEGDAFALYGTGCKSAGMAKERLDGREKGEECLYRAKAVIIATGVHPRELGIAGEKEYRSRGVSYCTVCDGPIFKGKITATIGGGNSGLESSIMLAGIAQKHYILHIGPDFSRGDPILVENMRKTGKVVEIMNTETTEILGDGKKVTGLKYKDKESGKEKEIALDGIFVHIGMVPNSEIAPSDLEKSDFKEIKVDARCATNIPGLFAAGDVTDVPYKQIGIAVGQGITAALSAVDYLQKQKA